MTTVAIVGLGAAVRNIHLPAYSQLAGKLKVVGGCDPDAEARGLAQSRFGVPAVFANLDEMLAAVTPDVVSICTPPAFHRAQVLQALSRGCHVFCEKPLADDLAEADEIIQAAAAANRTVVVNNQFPYMAIHRAAKSKIGTPEFGSLLHVHASHTMRTTAITEAGWRGHLSRRLCFEFGIHIFEIIRYLFDATPTRLMAHMPNPRGASPCDAVNVITMEFADGRGASMMLDRMSQGPDRYLDMRLDGERAIVNTSIGGQVEFRAGLHTRERKPFWGFSFVKGGLATLETGTTSRVIAQDGLNPFASSTAYHFGQFLDALAAGTRPPGEVSDNRKTLALVMAAYDSAAQGRWVTMADYGVV